MNYQSINKIIDLCINTIPSDHNLQVIVDKLDESINNTKLLWQIHSVYFYKTILNLTKSYYAILESNDYIGAASILRTIFEYHIEVLWLIGDLDVNLKQRFGDKIRIENKFFNQIGNSKNEVCKKIRNIDQINSRIKNNKILLNGQSTDMNLFEMCNKLGKEDMYISIYGPLSQYAHPNIIKLGDFYVQPSRLKDLMFNYTEYIKQVIIDTAESVNNIWGNELPHNFNMLVIQEIVNTLAHTDKYE